MKKNAIALIALLALVGCAGAKYAMDNYAKVKPVPFTASTGKGFRVYDKPAENRLMITPTIGASMGGGAVKGATFGAVNPSASEVVFRDASEEFLASTGRTCRALDIALVIDPQYEVRYECEATAVAPTSPPLPES